VVGALGVLRAGSPGEDTACRARGAGDGSGVETPLEREASDGNDGSSGVACDVADDGDVGVELGGGAGAGVDVHGEIGGGAGVDVHREIGDVLRVVADVETGGVATVALGAADGVDVGAGVVVVGG
jgi:hypothetical protein